MSTIEATKWYPIRVITGKERKTKELLEAEIRIEGLDKWVKSVIIPMDKESKIRDGKKIVRDKLTYPGYLLIEANLTGELIKLIKNCNGVAGFTTDGKNNPMYGRTPHNYIDIQINEVVNVILNNNEIKMIELSKFFDVGESTMLKKIHNFGYKGINELKQKVINEKNK
jgi:transcriptional antiterminator NusG